MSTASPFHSNHFVVSTPSRQEDKADDKKLHIPEIKVTGLPYSNVPYKSPKSPTFTSYIFKDLPVKPIAYNELDSFMNRIIIDVRCFNHYNTSRVKNSINICLPSTLLKRQSYTLPQILNSIKIDDDIKRTLLESRTNDIELLFYDDASDSNSISYQLYQTIVKFMNYNSNLQIYYLNEGFNPNKISPNLIDHQLSPLSPVDNNIPTLLSGFQLPTSTPSSQKFLSSMKTVPKLNISNITTNSKHSYSYNYNFHFSADLIDKADTMPQWLKRIFVSNEAQMNSNKTILNLLDNKFNKIETDEQLRLKLAINGQINGASSCNCTPSTPCPTCDGITYKIPKGIEFGLKNRYKNIFPFEHSRVKLSKDNSVSKECNCDNHNKCEYDDYFNGNFIQVNEVSDQRYIATQNPLNSTYYDFWNLVWFNRINLIICLNDQNSFVAPKYFDNQTLNGDIKIELIELVNHEHFNLRVLQLSKFSTNSSSVIYHLEFKNWPDFGIPDSKFLIDFIAYKNKLIETHNLNNTSLVHCSAGCGRTGTFITLDMIIDLIDNNKREGKYNPFDDIDLVYKSIQHQRRQRVSMVQNFDQFIFCYDTILKYIVQ